MRRSSTSRSEVALVGRGTCPSHPRHCRTQAATRQAPLGFPNSWCYLVSRPHRYAPLSDQSPWRGIHYRLTQTRAGKPKERQLALHLHPHNTTKSGVSTEPHTATAKRSDVCLPNQVPRDTDWLLLVELRSATASRVPVRAWVVDSWRP